MYKEIKFLHNVLNNIIDYKIIDDNYKNIDYYIKNKLDLEEYIVDYFSVEDVIKIIKDAKFKKLFLQSIEDFNIDKLYKSHIHGLNHNVRVLLFCFLISELEQIGAAELKIILEAAKYHDIGRINDFEDKTHGSRSANGLSFLTDKYTEEEMNILKTIVTAHSLDDTELEKVATDNNIKDIDKCKKMFKILKDADGLDRVRLEYPYIKIEFLRTEAAKKLVLFAYILHYNYELYM